MGTLRKYNLSQCPCEYFFETGTGLGSSLKHALHNGDFKKIFSTEIHSNTAAKAQLLFKKYRNVEIRNEKSTISLGKILPTLSKTDSILFFLDAHFPGEVSKGFKYENNEPNSLTMPLKEELKIIKSIRRKINHLSVLPTTFHYFLLCQSSSYSPPVQSPSTVLQLPFPLKRYHGTLAQIKRYTIH